jgi:hypothetical protein
LGLLVFTLEASGASQQEGHPGARRCISWRSASLVFGVVSVAPNLVGSGILSFKLANILGTTPCGSTACGEAAFVAVQLAPQGAGSAGIQHGP